MAEYKSAVDTFIRSPSPRPPPDYRQHILACIALLSIGCARTVVPALGADAQVQDGGCSAPHAMCSETCIDVRSDPLNCGRCNLQCEAALDCVDGQCAPRPPRLASPLSGSEVRTRTPLLRWFANGDSTRFRVRLCRERSCDAIIQEFDSDRPEVRTPEPLPAGAVFWMVASRGESGAVGTWSAPWEFWVSTRETRLDVAVLSDPDVDGDGFHDIVTTVGGYSIMVAGGGPLGATEANTRLLWPVDAPTALVVRITNVGDVNGDGFSDIAGLGCAPGDRCYPDRMFLFSGSRDSLSGEPMTTIRDRSSDQVFLGSDVYGFGDCDGDGYGDVLLVPHSRHTPPTRAFVYAGSPGGLVSDPRWTLSLTDGEEIVTAAPAGDVNGDGNPDLIVVGQNHERTTRSVNVVSMQAGAFIQTQRLFSVLCLDVTYPSISNGGDVNGDGYSDVALLFPFRSSPDPTIEVYLGGPSGLSSTPATHLLTARTGESVYWVNAIDEGDFDGDDVDEIAVARNSRLSSWIEIYRLGPESPIATVSRPQGIWFGKDVAAIDLDSEATDELVVGDPAIGQTGALFVFDGFPFGMTPSQTLYGPPPPIGRSSSALGGAIASTRLWPLQTGQVLGVRLF